jgi:hypothetical protein
MARKNFLKYLIAFMVAMLVMGGVIYAQAESPTPSAKGGLTPTPTRMPGRAPSTGLGGGW